MYTENEFKIVAWNKRTPLPANPQKLALYVVKDGLKFEMYFTDSMGNYLNNEAPTSTIEKTSDINLNDGEDGTSRYVEEKDLTFKEDIKVLLLDNKTVGKYRTGDTIPSTGMTFEEFAKDISQEYLTPKFLTFNIAGQSKTVEVGTKITGNKNFTFTYTNGQNVEDGTIKITDTTNSNVIKNNGSKTSPVQANVGVVTRTTNGINNWRIEAKDTENTTFSEDYFVTWKYGYFFGQSDTDVTTSSQVRAFPLVLDVGQGATTFSNVGLDDGGTFKFKVNLVTDKSNFYLFIKKGRKISYVSDATALNADITGDYKPDGTLTIKDAGGNDQIYNKYKYTIAGGYEEKHQHDITIINE